MTSPLIVHPQVIADTLMKLQEAGRHSSERVVMWLGRHGEESLEVRETYLPHQEADYDFFHIPPEAIQQLLNKLRSDRLMIAAQVHSHPQEAFHSKADDTWAIVRHAGALSLVLPNFALETRLESFKKDAAVFVLSPMNVWQEVVPSAVDSYYQIRKWD